MESQPPTQEEWLALYQAAQKVKKLAPWELMVEDDVFGVTNPATGELGFVSVMGMLGEHFAVALYLGAEALHQFLEFEEIGEDMPQLASAEHLLSMRHVQAAFEDRETLEQEDLATIKSLGLKFRGRGAWPTFRSYEAGLFPWST